MTAKHAVTPTLVHCNLNPEPLFDSGHLLLTRHEGLDSHEDSLLRLPDLWVMCSSSYIKDRWIYGEPRSVTLSSQLRPPITPTVSPAVCCRVSAGGLVRLDQGRRSGSLAANGASFGSSSPSITRVTRTSGVIAPPP